MSDSPIKYRIGCNERGCQLCAVGWYVEYEYYVREIENIRGAEKLRYLLEPAFRLSRGWGVIKNEWRDDEGSYVPFYHGRPVTMGEDLMFVLEDARQLNDSSHGKALTQAINKMIKFKGHLYNLHRRTDFECLGIPGPIGWFCRRNPGDKLPVVYDNPSDPLHGQHVKRPLCQNSHVDPKGIEVMGEADQPATDIDKDAKGDDHPSEDNVDERQTTRMKEQLKVGAGEDGKPNTDGDEQSKGTESR